MTPELFKTLVIDKDLDVIGISIQEQHFPSFRGDTMVIEIMNHKYSDVKLIDNDEEMTMKFRNTEGVETYIHISREMFSKMVFSFLEEQE